MNVFSLDDMWYDTRAQEILTGEWPLDKSYERGPLYPYFLAGIYSIFGHEPNAVRILQHILGAIQVGLIYLIALNLFRPFTAFVIGIFAGKYGAFIMLEGEILIESLALFFVVSGLYLLVKQKCKAVKTSYFFAGLFFGLATIARPNVILVIPLIMLMDLVEKNISKSYPRLVFFFLGACLCILPVTLRNSIIEKNFVPISSHGGINFYIGNNIYSDGHTAAAPMKVQYGEHYEDNILVAAERVAELETKRSLSSSEVSSFWYGKGWDFIRDHTGLWIKLELKKFLLILNAVEITNFRDMLFFAENFSVILKVTFLTTVVILPLGIVGFFLGLSRFRELAPLFALTLATVIILLGFFVTARYRVMMMPALILFSGMTVEGLLDDFRNKKFLRFWGVIIICIVLLGIGQLNIDGIRDISAAGSWNSIGKLYIQQGDLKNAERYIEKALTQDPKLQDPYGNPWVNLGRIKYHLGKEKEALTAYETALKFEPENLDIRHEMKIVKRGLENQ